MNATTSLDYRHTQYAPWCVILYVLAAVLLVSAWQISEQQPIAIVLALSGVTVLLLAPSFHHLTVANEGNTLAIRFGPLPLFQKRIRYADIESAEVGRTHILDGWGIHYSVRGGWVWNIYGRDCVVIRLHDRVLRVGTNDANGLAQFLNSTRNANANA